MTKSRKRMGKRSGQRMSKRSKRVSKRSKRVCKRVKRQRGGAWWENLTGTRKVDIKNPEIYTKRKFTTTQFNNDKCYDILNDNHYSSPYFQKCNNMLAYIVENPGETKIEKLLEDISKHVKRIWLILSNLLLSLEIDLGASGGHALPID